MFNSNFQHKTKILIIGGGSKIVQEVFKLTDDFDVTGFSKFSNTTKTKEFKILKYKNILTIKNYLEKIKKRNLVLILAQAKSRSNIILNKSSKELYDDMESNFFHFHEVIRLVLPFMLQQRWGRIIFLGSSGALKTDVGLAGYACGKYATLGYCKTLSKEYARYGVTSNYLSLGLFNTPLYLKLPKSVKSNLLKRTDTNGTGDYESILNAIIFLIKSNYVSGSIIPVDGGFN